ncbi:MAG: glycerol kinase GlpK [Planctomycetota bacterium]|nr:glycerol kinase GlpK [Planctomycetota bacterium]
MSDRYILALDEGTSSVRAIVFDHLGRIRGVSQQEFTQIFPEPGCVEHDAEEIWDLQISVAQRAIDDAGIQPVEVSGLGITNQRETVVVWDRSTGAPIHNAIVWQDRRTTPHCDELRQAGHAEMIRKRTGLVLDPYFSGTKLQWILDHVPDARERARRGELAAGTIDSWLTWKLTGGACHVTDVSNASRTLLYDINECGWNDELLALFDVPREMLPEVVPTSGVVGRTRRELLGAEIPIGGMIGDQQAALFGQLCVKPGMVKNTYGTGCFMLMNTGGEPVFGEHQLLTTVGWQIGDGPVCYAIEGSVFIAGAAIQWLRDGLGIIQNAREINALAQQVSDCGGVQFVPAFTGLGAPYWDPTARGAIFGLTRGTTRSHLARATLHSLALQSTDVINAMCQDGSIQLPILRVDGGASASDLLLQMQADLLGVPVERPDVLESTALGAAYMAGLAVGLWKGLDELETHRTIDQVFEPTMTEDQRQSELSLWHKAVKRTLRWDTEEST